MLNSRLRRKLFVPLFRCKDFVASYNEFELKFIQNDLMHFFYCFAKAKALKIVQHFFRLHSKFYYKENSLHLQIILFKQNYNTEQCETVQNMLHNQFY